jgi:hypothetical protein
MGLIATGLTSVPILLLLTVLVPSISQGGCTAQKTNGKVQDAESNEEALIVYIRLSDEKSGDQKEREAIFKLEDELILRIEKSGAGEYDGNEIGEGFFTLYMYGTSAGRLWDVASALIKAYRVPSGSYAVKRYGKPGSKQDRISLPE